MALPLPDNPPEAAPAPQDLTAPAYVQVSVNAHDAGSADDYDDQTTVTLLPMGFE